MKLMVDASRTANERYTVQSVPRHRSTASEVAELSGLLHVSRTLPATVEATTSFEATKDEGTTTGGVSTTVVVSGGTVVVSAGGSVVVSAGGSVVVSAGGSVVVSAGSVVVSAGIVVVSAGIVVVVSAGGSTTGGTTSGG